MKLLLAVCLFAGFVSVARADVPPPYDLFGVGAVLEQAEPYPRLAQIQNGGPAEKSGLKSGDAVIAINGGYAKGGAPFYFFARGLQGPKDSFVELVILREGREVFTVKIKRTVALR